MAPTAPRDLQTFQEWAGQCGVQFETGFCLVQNTETNDLPTPDFQAATSTGGDAGATVLVVPRELHLSAATITQDYNGYVDASLAVLAQQNMGHLARHFHLFVRVLVEYEAGTGSPFYPWLAALPRQWNTAVSMDDFCLSCLPPFIKSLCVTQRTQLQVFRQALQAFEYVSPETKANAELLKFAYNVVWTRSWPPASEDTDDGNDSDLLLIPMADMFNHGEPANVELQFDDDTGACRAVLTQAVAPGQALHVSYGQPTNPSRFLATFGFLNQAPATYCKLRVPYPSQELVDVGYDASKMLVFTADGGIAGEVWDVVLYSRLERQADLVADKQAFYQAHMSGDAETKGAIHGKHFQTTCRALQRHAEGIIAEISDLSYQMNAYDSSKHPRLPLLKKHNAMVEATFQKMRANIEQISQ
jgi:hypothetical protein